MCLYEFLGCLPDLPGWGWYMILLQRLSVNFWVYRHWWTHFDKLTCLACSVNNDLFGCNIPAQIDRTVFFALDSLDVRLNFRSLIVVFMHVHSLIPQHSHLEDSVTCYDAKLRVGNFLAEWWGCLEISCKLDAAPTVLGIRLRIEKQWQNHGICHESFSMILEHVFAKV